MLAFVVVVPGYKTGYTGKHLTELNPSYSILGQQN